MGCNCGKRRPVAATVQAEPVTGSWVAVYPSGERKVFNGTGARRNAERTALSAGGTFFRVAEADPKA